MAKLASQADLCYNKLRNIVAPTVLQTPGGWISLYERNTMNTLPLPAQDGNPLEKCCTACNTFFPATTEFFHRKHTGKYGLDSRCKECKNKKDAIRNQLPEVRKRKHARYKTYYEDHRDQPGVRQKKLAYGKAYRSRPETQEYTHLWNKVYNSRPEIRERTSIQKKAYHSKPEVKAAYNVHYHNRRALKKNALGTHTPAQIQEQYERQKGKCYYCHKKVTWGKHHVDHVVPLARGGSNDISNLVISCATCNLSKNKKLPHEFYEGGRLL